MVQETAELVGDMGIQENSAALSAWNSKRSLETGGHSAGLSQRSDGTPIQRGGRVLIWLGLGTDARQDLQKAEGCGLELGSLAERQRSKRSTGVAGGKEIKKPPSFCEGRPLRR